MILGELGAVEPNQVVEWVLPTSLAVPDTTLHLSLVPVTDDAAIYWALSGAVPPALTIAWE